MNIAKQKLKEKIINKNCDLYCKINGSCMHVYKIYNLKNKCNLLVCPKKLGKDNFTFFGKIKKVLKINYINK